MTEPTRRAVVAGLAALAAGGEAAAQGSGRQPAAFGFDEVDRRARDIAKAPYDARAPSLPAAIAKLDYDAWRDIRFRPDRAFLGSQGGPFRLQLFHLGFLYTRPVTVNLVRDGIATPIPYQASLFDLGRTKLDKALPVDLGFAGLRLHTTLNAPNVLDELVVFLGASYYRFLGRDQLYGLSARGLALDVAGEGGPEEFPAFREFWVEMPGENAEACTILALLDGPSLAGAYQFTVRPGVETVVSVRARLHPRRALDAVGLAPLTSMYALGENDRGHPEEYRPEIHDSDGLQIATGTGEWLWRPLRNPATRAVSAFADRDPRGFGLMQRDRSFADYQDLEAGYERRPSYFCVPEGAWGEGEVVLVELPTDSETNDNVVAFWRPKQPYPAGEPVDLAYGVRASSGAPLHPGGRVANTFVAAARASGSRAGAAPEPNLRRRFLVDFTGGDLAYHLADPGKVECVATTSQGRITATSVVPNPRIGGFRAALDVTLDRPGQATDLRAFLRAGGRTMTETWTYPWAAA